MGIIEKVTAAFEHPDNWVEFECEDCGKTFRIDRADDRVCPDCGSKELVYLDSA